MRWERPFLATAAAYNAAWVPALLLAPEAAIGRALIEGVRNETVVVDASARATFRVRPLGIEESVRRAFAESARTPPALRGRRSAAALALLLGATLLVGALGGVANGESVRTWYPTIAKPAWTPPAWPFGPVWTSLYVAMAVAAWRAVARDGVLEARLPLALFGLPLALNGAWSWPFFGARAPAAALVEIVVLLVAVLATTVFFAARRTAFATALNAEIVRLAR
jgi:tryptophan-rich sensory protein